MAYQVGVRKGDKLTRLRLQFRIKQAVVGNTTKIFSNANKITRPKGLGYPQQNSCHEVCNDRW
ncbi:hypothetical protein JCM12296A_34160 [Desulfosarcina cetonica]